MDSFSIGSHHALPSLAISAVDIAMSGAEVPSVMRNASLSLYIYILKREKTLKNVNISVMCTVYHICEINLRVKQIILLQRQFLIG